MTRREMALFALLGLGVWLQGAVMFRLGGRVMFESGPWVLLLSGAGIALSVCVLLRTVMTWRKAPASQAVLVAVIMALPGLFGDVAYISAFHWFTGLNATTAAPFAAMIIFGNAVLLTYALVRARPPGRRALVQPI
jgi:hypothetical protein